MYEKKSQTHFFFLLLFRLFMSEILSRQCPLSRTTSDPAQKGGNCRPKRFSCFSGKRIGTISSRRSRLSRTSRDPSKLIRPRLINCDRGRDRQVQILFSNITKKRFFSFPLSSPLLIYTPKEAHSRIFVTGRSFFARKMLAKNKLFLGRPACKLN